MSDTDIKIDMHTRIAHFEDQYGMHQTAMVNRPAIHDMAWKAAATEILDEMYDMIWEMKHGKKED